LGFCSFGSYGKYLTDEIAGRDASICWSPSHHPKKEYILDPSGFRCLKLHEATFKGFDAEAVNGPGLPQASLEGGEGVIF
jgi:hypothetical protein